MKKFKILFFTEFSPQRTELRKIWNETNSDWEGFLKLSEQKVLKFSEKTGMSLEEISITCHIRDFIQISTKIISLSQAKKLFAKKIKVYQIFTDGSECIIENDSDFNDVVESKTKIGIKIPN